MSSVSLVPAAQYIRMSTEHQQYSLVNQDAAIKQYAGTHSFSVVRTYADPGRSGLNLKSRHGLRQLLKDVVSGTADFAAILVYDVSRWGRFQDTDESAHYEFICRSAGIPVHYCAELFVNDGSVVNMIMKALKRMMAGEYSRELSAKVFEGASRLAKLGFKQGGMPGFGYRRQLVSPSGRAKEQLERGERKSIQEDRVVLIPGPEHEICWVREIFRMYAEEGKGQLEISKILNAKGVKYYGIRRDDWYPQAVYRLLKNKKYIGCNVYGQSSRKLGSPDIKPPASTWTVVPDCWPALIDPSSFNAVQRRFAAKPMFKPDEDLIAELTALLTRKGKLSERLVTHEPDLPSQSVYRRRFGSMSKAFALAGYNNSKLLATKLRRQRRALRDRLLGDIVANAEGQVSIAKVNEHFRPSLIVSGRIKVSVYIVPCSPTNGGNLRWIFNTAAREQKCPTLLARLNPDNADFHDYFVLPSLFGRTRWTMTEDDRGLEAGKKLTSLPEFKHTAEEICRASVESGVASNQPQPLLAPALSVKETNSGKSSLRLSDSIKRTAAHENAHAPS